MVKKAITKKAIYYYLPLVLQKKICLKVFSDLEMQSIDVIKYRINM